MRVVFEYIAKLLRIFFEMSGKTIKIIVCAIVSGIFILSAVCDSNDEEYADVNCQYRWGGTVCDCENLKYVIADSICCSHSKVFH